MIILYQTNLIRKEQKASVMPSITIGYTINLKNGTIREELSMLNQGIGPAFIKSVEIISYGEVLKKDPYAYLSATAAKGETKNFNIIFPGRIIPAGEKIRLYEKETSKESQIILGNTFHFPYDVSNPILDALLTDSSGTAEKAIIRIIYSNVYDDSWEFRSDEPSPKSID